MSYVPETCADLSFSGIADGAPRCRVHDLPSRRCVAFEGTNTGRRFHTCCVQDYVENCGFVNWVDAEEWPEALRNSLRRLWSMYHDSSDKRIEERIENARVVQKLVDERDKFRKNYYSLMDDVEKLMKDQEIIGSSENAKERRQLEAEVVKLNSELFDLKEEKKQWESMEKLRKEKWEKKEESWNEEKKKLEYTMFDLFKANSANKEKLLKIKEIIGEM